MKKAVFIIVCLCLMVTSVWAASPSGSVFSQTIKDFVIDFDSPTAIGNVPDDSGYDLGRPYHSFWCGLAATIDVNDVVVVLQGKPTASADWVNLHTNHTITNTTTNGLYDTHGFNINSGTVNARFVRFATISGSGISNITSVKCGVGDR
jgi:hypothetical protein